MKLYYQFLKGRRYIFRGKNTQSEMFLTFHRKLYHQEVVSDCFFNKEGKTFIKT